MFVLQIFISESLTIQFDSDEKRFWEVNNTYVLGKQKKKGIFKNIS